MKTKKTKELEEIIKNFIKTENARNLSYTFDIYTEKENFIAIKGILSEGYAKDVASILKEDKKYKVTELGIVISNENYEVIEIKKNLEAYLNTQKKVAVPAQTIPAQTIPAQTDPSQPAVDVNSPDDKTPEQLTPAASKASSTKPAGVSPKTESNNAPKTSSTQK